jgi:preprotein translocase subunit SecG
MSNKKVIYICIGLFFLIVVALLILAGTKKNDDQKNKRLKAPVFLNKQDKQGDRFENINNNELFIKNYSLDIPV